MLHLPFKNFLSYLYCLGYWVYHQQQTLYSWPPGPPHPLPPRTAAATSNQTRIYLAESGDEMMANHLFGNDDDLYQDNYTDGYLSSSDPISSVPTTYQRWDEEARLLDGASMHDCIQGELHPVKVSGFWSSVGLNIGAVKCIFFW